MSVFSVLEENMSFPDLELFGFGAWNIYYQGGFISIRRSGFTANVIQEELWYCDC